jgi:hypothetical protein
VDLKANINGVRVEATGILSRCYETGYETLEDIEITSVEPYADLDVDDIDLREWKYDV